MVLLDSDPVWSPDWAVHEWEILLVHSGSSLCGAGVGMELLRFCVGVGSFGIMLVRESFIGVVWCEWGWWE